MTTTEWVFWLWSVLPELFLPVLAFLLLVRAVARGYDPRTPPKAQRSK